MDKKDKNSNKITDQKARIDQKNEISKENIKTDQKKDQKTNKEEGSNPTKFGDWQINGRTIDF